MSRETVYALRRFTQKMAAGLSSPSTAAPNLSLAAPGQNWGVARDSEGAGTGAFEAKSDRGQYPIDMGAMPYSVRALDAKGKYMAEGMSDRAAQKLVDQGLPNPADMPAPGPALVPSTEVNPTAEKPFTLNSYRHGLENGLTPPKQSWQDLLASLMGNVDWSTVGGGALGGLGGYGLARLLQSREDEEKKRFPWLSTLAGTAAGSLLLPALLNSSYMQGGQSGGSAQA